ncbi:MAG: biopolymer transporter ExbD [candidate division Zixibacteria bacterium]|nr:biopolymer transporter ExbD [candidate division Zixibacteria bacterium]
MKKRLYPALYDINVTNLVDVVLVLLIIFMITAPMLQSGIDINLPKTVATQKDLGEGIVVTINKERRIFVDDKITSFDKFKQRLGDLKSKKGANAVYLRADETVPYGFVVDVMGKIKDMGITNLGLVIEPVEKR